MTIETEWRDYDVVVVGWAARGSYLSADHRRCHNSPYRREVRPIDVSIDSAGSETSCDTGSAFNVMVFSFGGQA